MKRFGLGVGLLCLTVAGCTKQQPVSNAPAHPTPVSQAGPYSAVAPVAVAPEAPEDPNRPWIAAAAQSDYMLIGQNEHTFGVWVDVPKTAAGHVPTALSLVVDTSGSMRGDKIRHARDAARRMVEELEDGDLVSLVSFASQAEVLVPPTVLDHHARRELLSRIEDLTGDGGTALRDGLALGESQIWNAPDTHLVRRVVVISDGKATIGETSPDRLGRIAQTGLERGVQVTALGVGLQYDETTLNELAVRSSGRLYHVENSHQLPGIIEEEVALLESTAAGDAHVELVAAPGVQLLGTDVAHSRRTNEGLRVPLGTMFAGQKRELLVKAHVHDHGVEGPKVLASVRLHFRDPAGGGLARVQEAVLRATITDDPSLVTEHANSRMETLLAVRDASGLTRLASQQLNQGDLDAADRELARAEKRLNEQKQRAKTAKEKQQVSESASRIAKQRSGIKKAKRRPAADRKKDSRRLSLEANADAMMADGYSR